jgi:hypothetical protein
LDFNLEIFDRMANTADPNYQWPAAYRHALRGSLPYAEMLTAYKRYKAFLNVNSVSNSPTMFARRVFELLACGTPVISSYARGIAELLGEDAVCFTDSEAETRRHLERLLGDDEAWARASARGVRRVMARHTYADRLAEVRRRLGLGEAAATPARRAIVLARLDGASDLQRLRETLAAQRVRPGSAVLLGKREALEGGLEAVRGLLAEGALQLLPGDATGAQPAWMLDALRSSPGDWVWAWRPDSHYGPGFLEDALLAARYARGCQAVGKASHLAWAEGAGCLVNPGHEYRWVENLPSRSVLVRRDVLTTADLDALVLEDGFAGKGRRCLSIDRFNFLAGPLPEGRDWRAFASSRIDE